jgi:hypothetical protein
MLIQCRRERSSVPANHRRVRLPRKTMHRGVGARTVDVGEMRAPFRRYNVDVLRRIRDVWGCDVGVYGCGVGVGKVCVGVQGRRICDFCFSVRVRACVDPFTAAVVLVVDAVLSCAAAVLSFVIAASSFAVTVSL